MKALEITDLRKTYPNGPEALKGINLSIDVGDFFALLGPNGAGKSTTIGIITSLVNKTGGQIKIFGHDLENEPEKAKSCIGLVPQEFNFNVFETLEQILIYQAGYYGVPTELAIERAEHYLKKLGLWEKRHTPSRFLSGGMKRRLMIARALMHDPKMLILDEPTASVDIEVRHMMWAFLKEINKEGKTIILTTHYLEEAENLCRNIAIIHRGKVIKNTRMRSLLNELTQETFIFETQNILATLPKLEGYILHPIDEHSFSVILDKPQSLNNVFTELTRQQIVIKSMRNQSNRLEQLFLDLVRE